MLFSRQFSGSGVGFSSAACVFVFKPTNILPTAIRGTVQEKYICRTSCIRGCSFSIRIHSPLKPVLKLYTMKYFFTTCCLLLPARFSLAQSPSNFWKEVSYEQIFLPENAETVDMPANYRLLSLDFDGLRNYLRNAPAEGTPNIREHALPVSLPMPDGRMENFMVWESSVMAPELAAKYPMIKTYAGQGVDNPHYTLRMGTGLDGFHAVILAENGGSIISRYATNQTKYYLNYSKSDIRLDQLNLPPELIKVVQMESKKKEAEQVAAHKGGVRGGATVHW